MGSLACSNHMACLFEVIDSAVTSFIVHRLISGRIPFFSPFIVIYASEKVLELSSVSRNRENYEIYDFFGCVIMGVGKARQLAEKTRT